MILLHIAGYEWLDWHVHPDVLLLVIALQGSYLLAVTRLRHYFRDAGRVKRSQIAYFTLGVFTLYAAAGTPIHDLSEEYLLSMHMVQHLLFTMVAPPLLIAGMPTWLIEAPLRQRAVMRAAKLLTSPLVAFGLFNSVLLLTHLPPVVDLALREHFFHFLVHVALVTTGVLMWWPVLSHFPELPRLSDPLMMGYLFVQSLLPAVLAAFITFSETPVYPFYEEAPRIWGLSAIEDQQVAGLTMKLAGSFILWSFIVIAFFRWYAREEMEARGPRWQDVQEDLDTLGFSKR